MADSLQVWKLLLCHYQTFVPRNLEKLMKKLKRHPLNSQKCIQQLVESKAQFKIVGLFMTRF